MGGGREGVMAATGRCPLCLLFFASAVRDRHDILLKDVWEMRQRRRDVVLEYLGSTKEQIACISSDCSNQIRLLGNRIIFYRRVADDQVSSICKATSFGVILREYSRRW